MHLPEVRGEGGMNKTTVERIAKTGHAIRYRDGSWWVCTAAGVIASRTTLSSLDCVALTETGRLRDVHDSRETATLYRMVEA